MRKHLTKFHNNNIATASHPAKATPSIKTFFTNANKTPSSSAPIRRNGSELSSQYEQTIRSCARLYASISGMRARFFENDSFQAFMNSICKKTIRIPSHNTVLKYVEIIYQEDKAAIIRYLAENCPQVISIIFDLWSEKGPLKRSFLNIQMQFSRDFEIFNINLATIPFSEKKEGEIIAKKIMEILDMFGLIKKFIIFMSDKGSNCLKAVRILLEKLGIKGLAFECLAHGLHNLINRDLLQVDEKAAGEISSVLKKLRSIRQNLTYKLNILSEKSKHVNIIMVSESEALINFHIY